MPSFLTLSNLLDWLSAHPLLAGFVVFLIALTESLAIVGWIVPGAVLMFAIGALIATGYLSFWPMTVWAIAGAIAGDGLSYWLGYYYKQRLTRIWPLSRHPDLLARGTAFFYRHGGKSILFGRFIGPLRPLLPAIAGMFGMSTWHFVVTNVISAMAWAPLYLLPGIAFGMSLELATEVAGRMVVLLITLCVLLIMLLWLMRRCYAWMAPKMDYLMARMMYWSRQHPLAGELPDALVNPNHPEARGLTILALLLVLSVVGFAGLTQAMTKHLIPGSFDKLIFHGLQNLRTPFTDGIMVWVTGLGDTQILFTLTAITSVWLIWHQDWRSLWHWLLALLFPFSLVHILKVIFEVSRPPLLPALNQSFAFPSGHATLALTVYGFLAVMLAREIAPKHRILLYTGALIIITSIAFSRLYLGAHWLSDVIGGLLLGLAWLTLLGIAYRRHASGPPKAPARVITLGLILLAISSTHTSLQTQQNMALYTPTQQHKVITLQQWLSHQWQALPMARDDLRNLHRHPLSLQWAGKLQDIQQNLFREGWKIPAAIDSTHLLHWLNPNPTIDVIPVLPQVHGGRYETLRLVKYLPNSREVLAIRLWDSGIIVHQANKEIPLWIGNISKLHISRTAWLTYLRTGEEFTRPLEGLTQPLREFSKVIRTHPSLANTHWDGNVILLWPKYIASQIKKVGDPSLPIKPKYRKFKNGW